MVIVVDFFVCVGFACVTQRSLNDKCLAFKLRYFCDVIFEYFCLSGKNLVGWSLTSLFSTNAATVRFWGHKLMSYTPVLQKLLSDTVPHRRLLSQLKSYNINQRLLMWIRDFCAI